MGSGAGLNAPSGNAGAMAMAMSKVHAALKDLHEQISQFSLSDPRYKGLTQAVDILNKHFPISETVPGLQKTTLAGAQAEAQQSPMLQAIMRGAGGPAGAAPGGPPGAGVPPPPAAGA